jgi:GNAT superfamily N-acetyltransferase
MMIASLPERSPDHAGPIQYCQRYAGSVVEMRLRRASARSPYDHPDYFTWAYLANPHNKNEFPEVWLALRNGRVVGQQCGLSCYLQIDETSYPASWAVDLYVEPEWRMRGVGPDLSQAHRAACDVAIGANVSDSAYRFYMRSGWLNIGKLQCFARIVDYSRLAKLLFSGGGALAVTMRSLCSTAHLAREARLKATAALDSAQDRRSSIQAHEVRCFDNRVDQLWNSARRQYVVAVRRDLKYLRWRFDGAPGHAQYRRLYMIQGETIVGYAVLRMGTFHGFPVGIIVDYFSAPEHYNSLLGHCLAAIREGGALAALCLTLNTAIETPLRRLGFMRFGQLGNQRLLTYSRVEHIRAIIAERKNWFVTLGDGDTEHGWLI